MKSVAICGSMDFYEEMLSLAERLTTCGWQTELPAAEEIKIDYSASSDSELAKTKKIFIDEHLTKIKTTDCVLIANYTKRGIDGYIGANTLMEAAFAYALGKPIFVLNELGEQPCRPEILGLQPTILKGDLVKLL